MESPLHHQEPDLASPAPMGKPIGRRRGWGSLLTIGVVVVLAGLLALEMLPHGQRPVGLAETAPPEKPPVPAVQVIAPKRSAAASALLLPGSVQAIQEAAIFARTNGYVHRRLVDIGDRVTAGQLLAEIASPEVDQELLQARAALLQARATRGQARANLKQIQAHVQQAKATLAQVRANTDMARLTAERWRQMAKEEIIPRQ